MTDRIHVEKAADAGAGKINLLQDDPLRYMLRAVGAGMGLTLVVFVFWFLKQNLHDISLGAVIASGFFGVGLMIIVFTNTELFTSSWSVSTDGARRARSAEADGGLRPPPRPLRQRLFGTPSFTGAPLHGEERRCSWSASRLD